MRILYLYQYFVARKGHGMTRSYEFARRLIDMGHQVTIVTLPGYLPAEYQNIKKTTRIDIEGVPVIILPVSYSNYMSFRRRIFAFVRFALLASWVCIRTPSDVIYASSGPLTIAIPAIVGKLWQRIPMVFEVRDLWPRMPIALGILKDPISKTIAKGLEWVAYHSSNHVVALSPGIAQGVQERGIKDSLITVIPNSSDVDLFDVSPNIGDSVRHTLQLEINDPLIVYTGSFAWMYNLSYLVEIAEQMRGIIPNCCFLLIGSGAEFEKVRTKALQYEVLEKTVFVWPAAPKTEMPAILSASTLTVSLTKPIPEFADNSANKFFDSLAAGRPIAINYGGWQADLLSATGAGIQIAADDPALAAKQIAEFLQDKERVSQAGQAARELAYTRFHRDLMAKKLESVLTQVVSH